MLTDSCTWARRDIRWPRHEEESQFYCRCRSGGSPARGVGRIMSCPKHSPDLNFSLKQDFRAVFTWCDALQTFSTLLLCLNTSARCSDGLINQTFPGALEGFCYFTSAQDGRLSCTLAVKVNLSTKSLIHVLSWLLFFIGQLEHNQLVKKNEVTKQYLPTVG